MHGILTPPGIKLGGVWGWRELSLSFGIGLASDADLASSTGGGSALFLSHVGYSGSCARVYIVAGMPLIQHRSVGR